MHAPQPHPPLGNKFEAAYLASGNESKVVAVTVGLTVVDQGRGVMLSLVLAVGPTVQCMTCMLTSRISPALSHKQACVCACACHGREKDLSTPSLNNNMQLTGIQIKLEKKIELLNPTITDQVRSCASSVYF